jgi:hypothetical protein
MRNARYDDLPTGVVPWAKLIASPLRECHRPIRRGRTPPPLLPPAWDVGELVEGLPRQPCFPQVMLRSENPHTYLCGRNPKDPRIWTKCLASRPRISALGPVLTGPTPVVQNNIGSGRILARKRTVAVLRPDFDWKTEPDSDREVAMSEKADLRIGE